MSRIGRTPVSVPDGVKVTLNDGSVSVEGPKGKLMTDRLIHVALPQVRDFRGLSARSFQGHGDYSLGIREQIIFPEIDVDTVEKVHGLTVSIVTTAGTDEEGRALLTQLGMPFAR